MTEYTGPSMGNPLYEQQAEFMIRIITENVNMGKKQVTVMLFVIWGRCFTVEFRWVRQACLTCCLPLGLYLSLLVGIEEVIYYSC